MIYIASKSQRKSGQKETVACIQCVHINFEPLCSCDIEELNSSEWQSHFYLICMSYVGTRKTGVLFSDFAPFLRNILFALLALFFYSFINVLFGRSNSPLASSEDLATAGRGRGLYTALHISTQKFVQKIHVIVIKLKQVGYSEV